MFIIEAISTRRIFGLGGGIIACVGGWRSKKVRARGRGFGFLGKWSKEGCEGLSELCFAFGE